MKARKKPEKLTKTASHSDYNAGRDVYKRIKEIERKEKEWKKRMASTVATIGDISYDANTMTTSVYNGNLWTSIDTSTIVTDHTTNNHALRVDGTLEVNGRDVMKEIDEMRDALLLLKRDVDMEAKYPKLRELKDEYERQLEKYKTFDTLKESK